jgi:phytoene/squalene synthetase
MSALGEIITKRSSFQTYITFKLLADHALVQDSFDGYAYFRWLDDQIDVHAKTKKERIFCIQRQKKIIALAYAKKQCFPLLPEEHLIYSLIISHPDSHSKLASFIKNFISIIEFDAKRKYVIISGKELIWYSKTLAVAVIDCIEYFINHNFPYPASPQQYNAAIGAHITHMLRDYYEDLEEGFINIPSEYLSSHNIHPQDTASPAFTDWVKQRVHEARINLDSGMKYWDNLPVLRSKIAAHWYCTRFLTVIRKIEKDRFVLRTFYPRKRHFFSYILILRACIIVIFRHFTRYG